MPWDSRTRRTSCALRFTSSLAVPLCLNPRFAAQILLAGGADDVGNGLAYSTRITNLGVGLQPTLVQENMGKARIEGCATNLPDGTVFMTSGAANGKPASRACVGLACIGSTLQVNR